MHLLVFVLFLYYDTTISNNGEPDTSSHNIEFLFLEFFSSHQKLLLDLIYRSSNIINFKPLFNKFPNLQSNTDTILIGDFNGDIL